MSIIIAQKLCLFQQNEEICFGYGSSIQHIILCALASTVACRYNRYCYTKWIDRDDPSGNGDYENFSLVSRTTVCPQPVGIQCQTTTGAPYHSTGENLTVLVTYNCFIVITTQYTRY